MQKELIVQGKRITSVEIAQISEMIIAHPEWHRSKLSQDLCQLWGWRNGKGVLKDMACRTLLLKLERMNEIRLPARQRPSPNAHRNRQITDVPHDSGPIESDLNALRPLRIEPLRPTDEAIPLFKFLLHRYHYLGHRRHCRVRFQHSRARAGHARH